MLHYNQDKTMKSKKLLIALAGCAAFVATACHGDLDIIQDNQLTASNMWTESSDVTTSAYGIYYLMRANFVSTSSTGAKRVWANTCGAPDRGARDTTTTCTACRTAR